MKFNINFVNQIKKFNGQKINLKIILTDARNHPLGPIGAMMMGSERLKLNDKAMEVYNGDNALISLYADMEFINNSGEEKLIFINNEFECNCIEIFRPDPPMIIEGKDISLWWSYHPLSDHELSQLNIIKDKAKIKQTNLEGDCFPIRDILVNGISHCLQPL